jgi:hypothetical protein
MDFLHVTMETYGLLFARLNRIKSLYIDFCPEPCLDSADCPLLKALHKLPIVPVDFCVSGIVIPHSHTGKELLYPLIAGRVAKFRVGRVIPRLEGQFVSPPTHSSTLKKTDLVYSSPRKIDGRSMEIGYALRRVESIAAGLTKACFDVILSCTNIQGLFSALPNVEKLELRASSTCSGADYLQQNWKLLGVMPRLRHLKCVGWAPIGTGLSARYLAALKAGDAKHPASSSSSLPPPPTLLPGGAEIEDSEENREGSETEADESGNKRRKGNRKEGRRKKERGDGDGDDDDEIKRNSSDSDDSESDSSDSDSATSESESDDEEGEEKGAPKNEHGDSDDNDKPAKETKKKKKRAQKRNGKSVDEKRRGNKRGKGESKRKALLRKKQKEDDRDENYDSDGQCNRYTSEEKQILGRLEGFNLEQYFGPESYKQGQYLLTNIPRLTKLKLDKVRINTILGTSKRDSTNKRGKSIKTKRLNGQDISISSEGSNANGRKNVGETDEEEEEEKKKNKKDGRRRQQQQHQDQDQDQDQDQEKAEAEAEDDNEGGIIGVGGEEKVDQAPLFKVETVETKGFLHYRIPSVKTLKLGADIGDTLRAKRIGDFYFFARALHIPDIFPSLDKLVLTEDFRCCSIDERHSLITTGKYTCSTKKNVISHLTEESEIDENGNPVAVDKTHERSMTESDSSSSSSSSSSPASSSEEDEESGGFGSESEGKKGNRDASRERVSAGSKKREDPNETMPIIRGAIGEEIAVAAIGEKGNQTKEEKERSGIKRRKIERMGDVDNKDGRTGQEEGEGRVGGGGGEEEVTQIVPDHGEGKDEEMEDVEDERVRDQDMEERKGVTEQEDEDEEEGRGNFEDDDETKVSNVITGKLKVCPVCAELRGNFSSISEKLNFFYFGRKMNKRNVNVSYGPWISAATPPSAITEQDDE